jgi:uncharacterized repeat protein (TIGR01451 family)
LRRCEARLVKFYMKILEARLLKRFKNAGFSAAIFRWLWLVLAWSGLTAAQPAKAGGTWAPVANQAPDNIDTMLLLTDGTVMAASGEPGNGNIGNAWYLLTPDKHGSYANGTWSTLAPMHDTRLYYSSQVLLDGRVFIAGGEYGSGTGTAEVYDPLNNFWTELPDSGQQFVDSGSMLIPGGNVLVCPVAPSVFGGTVVYNPTLNTWSSGGTLVRGFDEDEASLVKLPDDSVLVIDAFTTNSERYIPSLNQWVDDGILPVPIYDSLLGEMGPGFLLPDGRAFFLGDTSDTVFYQPTGSTSPGTWTAGAVIPNSLGTPDAPGALMPNGIVLCALTPVAQYGPPTFFYEFDPVANAFTQVSAPSGSTLPIPPYVSRMLILPDGTVLYSTSSPQLFVYTPGTPPLAAGQPTITSISANADGSYHLVGQKLNGISSGAGYGDDAQEETDYPLVRLTDNSGNVYYARTYNRSSTSVATGNASLTTEFIVPPGVPSGTYSLVVTANGNSSAPVSFVNLPAPDLLLYTNVISGGNSNGIIDFDECNTLDLILTNAGSASATSVRATLATTTPGVAIAQTTSSFPDIGENGTGTNLTSFQISTSPTFACGTPISLTLVVSCAQNTSTIRFTLPTGITNQPVAYANTSVVSIPDNSPAGTNSTIVVSNLSGTLVKATVSLNILHQRDSDLTLKLVSPDGTSVTLSRTNGGNGMDYGTDCTNVTTFDDSATMLIDFGTAPFVGTFRPDQALSVFAGKTGSGLNGAWNLHVVDQVLGDLGTIQCWSLNLFTASCSDGGGQCPGVDLAVGMTATPNPVIISSNLTYTISVTNNGPDTAHSVSLTQVLPSGATFKSASSSRGTVGFSGGLITASLGNMNVDDTATITVVVTVGQAGIAFSTVTVGSTEADINPFNNTATVAVQVDPPDADLSIGLSADQNPILLGGVLTYTVSVTNNGPTAATNVVVTSTLPLNVSIVSANSSVGSSAIASGKVVTSIPSLGDGSKATITVQVRAVVISPITMTSTVTSSTVDPIPNNNTATLTVAVAPASDLSLSMTGSPVSAAVGSNITYTLTMLNLGPSPAANVSVSDTLPPNVTLVSETNNAQGTFVISGNMVTCAITNLGVNSNAVITIVINTTPLVSQVPVTIVNSATVMSSEDDPNPANNSASVSTRVDNPRSLIVADGSILATESFVPTNGFIDPGETVTVDFRLQNIGNLNTTNLVATLQATGGVVLTNGAQVQSYGSLPAGGAGVLEPFTFAANTTNGGTLTATLKLQDGAANLGTVNFAYTLPGVSAFTNTNNIIIPDHGEAPPYPSVINVSGVTGLISKVTVTLTNVNHTYPDDIDMLLVGPAGQSTLLMSHCGGGGQLNDVSLTFDDLAALFLPTSGQITSGPYKPTQNGSVNFPLTNTPAPPYGTNFAGSFNGTNANGNWSLYVFDSSPGDSGSIIGGWSLAIATGTPVNDIVDLGISGTGVPNSVSPGTNLTYTFTITNNGPNVANSVEFTNILPPTLNFVSVASTQGTNGVNSSGAIFCTVSNLAVGANFVVTIVVTPTLPGMVTNSATVTSADSDLNQANNTAFVTTMVTAPTADLALSLSALPSPAVVGSNLVYTIVVTNKGPGEAINAVVTEPLGALGFVSAISSPLLINGANVSGTATCNLGNIAPGATASVLLTVVPPATGLYTNVASVTNASTDPVSTNNSASLVITAVNPQPNIIVAGATLLPGGLTSANGAINPGETVSVSFVMTNNGSAGTSNVVATLLSSNGVTPLSGSQSYGALLPGGVSRSNTFTFSASGTNGGILTTVFQLQDGSTNLGTATFSFNLPTTNTFVSATGITLNNGPGQPYPSLINVSGLTGVVSKVTVTLTNLTHSFPSDLEMLLVGPGGQKAVLMATVGGAYAITNVTLILDDAAASLLPARAQIASGTYKPTDSALVAPFPGPAPAGPYGAALGVYGGSNPNGLWALYALDDSTSDSGTLGGWSVSIVTVNPVNSAADIAVALSNPPGTPFAGQNFNYTLNVTNRGPAAATDLALAETMPLNLNFVSASRGSYSNQTGLVTFNLGSLPAGSNITFTITVSAAMQGVYNTSASVIADQTDLNPADNTASLATAVTTASPATLSGASYSNGVFTVTVTGPPGKYVFQGSPDLAAWTSISTNTMPGSGTMQLTDPNAGTFQRRYYRVYLVGP